MYIKNEVDYKLILLKNYIATGERDSYSTNEYPVVLLVDDRGQACLCVRLYKDAFFLEVQSPLTKRDVTQLYRLVLNSESAVKLCSVFRVSDFVCGSYERIEAKIPEEILVRIKTICEGCSEELKERQEDLANREVHPLFRYKVKNEAEGTTVGVITMTARDAALVAYVADQRNWDMVEDDGFGGKFTIDLESAEIVEDTGKGIQRLLRM